MPTRVARLAIALAALVLLSGCSPAAPEPIAEPAPVVESTEPLSEIAQQAAQSCAGEAPAVEPDAPPLIDCIFPDEEFFMFCSGANRQVPLVFKWSTSGAETVWFALGRVDDAEATSFSGPLEANAQYSGEPADSLRFDCQWPFTDYTMTAEGPGGRTTEQFSLFRRIP
ncbi:hypothetical protein [Microcella sp.]|uniref:hypothetical protein n=1 Tax=Microcella sp. TaxID=1913979 RepID=UPI0025670C75|nr:hypothetical protein [Microcella sp.]MBX9472340.1 hypothetical protein [Microcella sp.]